MENSKEDTSQNFETLFFLILFSLFIFASSSNPQSHTSSSVKYPSQNELVFGDILSHRNAIIFNSVSLPGLQKYGECTLHSTSYYPFSVQNIISDYNRGIAQKIILIRRTRLAIEPAPSWRLYYHLSSNEDENLPVLS